MGLAFGRSDLFLRWQDFLRANLVNEVFTPQINQVRPLLVVRQVCAYTPRHHHYERLVIHVEPIRAPDELVVGISDEWVIDIDR
jgi:hypothetical protein